MNVARLKSWLRENLALLVLTLCALVVRLYWNLKVHPPLEFAYSDMAGYIERANAIFNHPWRPEPWAALFPYGTHIFIFVIKWLFGRDNKSSIAVAFAVLGAIAVALSYLTTRRYTKRPWLSLAVGIALVVYYPWISIGGYAMSEMPFTVCVMAVAFFTLRLVDEGRPRDAWLLGLWFGLGAVVRSQILLGLAFLGVHFLLRRATWPRMPWRNWARVALPVAVLLGISSYRLHWHTGQYGLVSTNGPMNYAFGRCHCTGLEAHAPDGSGFFGPPPFYALNEWEKNHPTSFMKMAPANGTTIKFAGHMWDPKPIYEVAHDCVQKSGVLGQARYAVTHLIMLWGYNIPWPDQGQRAEFHDPMAAWAKAHLILIFPLSVLNVVLSLWKRRARSLLLTLHIWATAIVAMMYFGDARLRTPYDGILILLAFEGYAAIFRWIASKGWRRLNLPGRPRPAHSLPGAPAADSRDVS